MAGGWIKLMRDSDPEVMAYLLRRPNAWALLSMIALRARREGGMEPRSGIALEPGEALIGDFDSCGLTRQQYRTALTQLISTNQITTRTTNRGTVAKLLNSGIYEINAEPVNHLDNQQSNQRATSEQPLTRSKEGEEEIPFSEIVSYLNKATGKNFRLSIKSTRSHINARWREGFRLEDFKAVVDSRVADWGKDSEMAKYLRPSTLFGPKFEGYLQAAEKFEVEGAPTAEEIDHRQAAEETARIYGLSA